MRNQQLTLNWLAASAPLLLVLAALELARHGLFPFTDPIPDLWEFFYVHALEHQGMRDFLRFVSDWGNPLMYPIYAWILWTGYHNRDRKRTRLALIYLVMQLALCFALVRIMKIGFGMPRPGVEGTAQPFNFHSMNNSMPSGHTAEFVGALLPLCFLTRSSLFSFVAGISAALVGFSRIYLGWHHPEDVFVGWIVGSLSGWLIILLWQRRNQAASRKP